MVLGHHTNLAAALSILSDIGANRICLRAVSNFCKNDTNEIVMGERVLKRVMSEVPQDSMLHKLSYKNTGSVSFTAAEADKYFCTNYGPIRLEFDFSRYHSNDLLENTLIECQYVSPNNIDKYAGKVEGYIQGLMNQIRSSKMPDIAALVEYILMQHVVMQKVFSIKSVCWQVEKESRIVLELDDDMPNVDRPYKDLILPSDMLKRIVVYVCPSYGADEALRARKELICLLKKAQLGQNAPSVEVLDLVQVN